MKNCSFFIYFCWLLLVGCNPDFEEEDGNAEAGVASGQTDSSVLLNWSGDTDKFTIDAKKGIRLDDPQQSAGTAYLSFPSASILDTRWEFKVKLSFNPSANNYARFYLAASSDKLTEATDGYFIQIGGARDNISLYRTEEGESVLLASGREIMKGDNSPEVSVKVECDKNGYWTYWTRLGSASEYSMEHQVKDTRVQYSTGCGIYCVYTKSRCDGFTFQNIQLSNGVETVTPPDEPETPDNPELPEEVRHMLLFNEVMYNPDKDGAEYIELHNPTDGDITLPSLLLFKMKSTGEVFSTTKLYSGDWNKPLVIPSKGYVCFTRYPEILMQKHQTDGTGIIEISNFPQLSNSGGYLAIATNEEHPRTIDTCRFIDWMHDAKETKGVALEKRSPELSSLNANWHSSADPTGGSPGRGK